MSNSDPMSADAKMVLKWMIIAMIIAFVVGAISGVAFYQILTFSICGG